MLFSWGLTTLTTTTTTATTTTTTTKTTTTTNKQKQKQQQQQQQQRQFQVTLTNTDVDDREHYQQEVDSGRTSNRESRKPPRKFASDVSFMQISPSSPLSCFSGYIREGNYGIFIGK